MYQSAEITRNAVVLMDGVYFLMPSDIYTTRLPSTIELPLCIMPRRCKCMRGTESFFVFLSFLDPLLDSFVRRVPSYLVRRASFETFRCILLNKLRDVTCYRTHYIVRGSVEIASVALQHRNIMSAQVGLL